MPGGIPHWVLGTSNSICVGRHFYGASTIRSSVITIVHTFLLAGALTNEDLLETRTFLYQLLVFWSTRFDKRDVDGESIVKYCNLVLNNIPIRGSHPGLFLRGRFFRCLISRGLCYSFACFRPPFLPNQKSSGECCRRSLPCKTTFPLPFPYILYQVYCSLGGRGGVAFLHGGPHGRRVRSRCCELFESY